MYKIGQLVEMIEPNILSLDKSVQSRNVGKKRAELVSYTILKDAFLALKEFDVAIMDMRYISADLLIRYLYESEIGFLYLFEVNKGKQQLCDAYLAYAELQRAKMLGCENLIIQNKKKWINFIGNKPSNQNHWSGLKISELVNILEGSQSKYYQLYKIFSGFSHPGALSLERTESKASNIYMDYFKNNADLSVHMIGEMFTYAFKNNLYGIKLKNKNQILKKIKVLLKD